MTRNEDIIGKINEFLVEEFEVDASKIKPEDFTNISTFQDFYDYIISRVNTKAIA